VIGNDPDARLWRGQKWYARMTEAGTRRGKRVMNVLLTSAEDAGVGGVQVVFRDLVHWLELSGRQVYLVYQSRLPRVGMEERATPWGHPAFYCPMPAFVTGGSLLSVPIMLAYLPIAVFHLARLVRRQKIDVINCHFLAPYFVHLVIVARLLRVPIVVSVHGADVDAYSQAGRLERFLLRLVVRGADRIVACSAAMARQTIEAFPNARAKVSYVHNGVDLAHFADVPGRCAVRQPMLLCVCRHVLKKGVDTLLHAHALVLRDLPEMSLVLIGDGPLLEEHQALARTLQIEHRVIFTGSLARADAMSFFEACTLFVLPSRAEPFGIVLLEAGYYKKAIVATRVGGIPEIIVDGFNGVLVEPDAPADMAAQIVALVRDPRRAELLGARVHETLSSHFLWKDRVHDYVSIYEGRPSGPRATWTRDVEPFGMIPPL